MSPSKFEAIVLDWTLNDYEGPQTLAQDISKELGRIVTETEVLCALISLAQAGLVQTYIYEDESAQFKTIDPNQAQSMPNVWFMATPTGRAAVEHHAG